MEIQLIVKQYVMYIYVRLSIITDILQKWSAKIKINGMY